MVARSPLDPVVIVCKRIVAKHGDLVRDEHFRLAKVMPDYCGRLGSPVVVDGSK